MEASCCAEKGVSMLDVGKNFTAEDAANGKCSPSELSTDEFLRYIALLSESLITPSKHSEATAEDVLGRNSDISSLSSEELVRLFFILVNKEPDADTAKAPSFKVRFSRACACRSGCRTRKHSRGRL